MPEPPKLILAAFDYSVGEVMRTAALEDIARSKEAAGRAKDLKTLPAIHAHLDRMRRDL